MYIYFINIRELMLLEFVNKLYIFFLFLEIDGSYVYFKLCSFFVFVGIFFCFSLNGFI